MHQRKLVLAVFAACGGGLVWCCHHTLQQGLFEPTFWVNRLESGGGLLFVVAYAVFTALGVPGTILTIAGGVVFGLWWGTLWSVLGATLGAIAAFCLARYLLHDWVQQRFGQHRQLHRFQRSVRRMPLRFVLAVRFAPISPFNLVNFLLGLTPISLRTYAIGTFFGIIPGSLAYTWLGITGQKAIQDGMVLPLFMALMLLSGLSILPWVYKRSSWRY
ncbi:MAG: TVP38/TMEM64 family protein [Spirulina sp. SIO3F2]|nr:TVP38/TMEM64 family protein [Spirulina sp. SIO3F2]